MGVSQWDSQTICCCCTIEPYRKEGYSWTEVSKTAYLIEMDIHTRAASFRFDELGLIFSIYLMEGALVRLHELALISFRGYGEFFDPTQQSVYQEQSFVRLSHGESLDWE